MDSKVRLTRLDLEEIWQNSLREFTDKAVPRDFESQELKVYLLVKGFNAFLQKHEIDVLDFSLIDGE